MLSWGPPPPGVLVRENVAAEPTPATVALTVYAPAIPLAVNTADVAIPEAPVTAVLVPPAKVPLGPEPGAENVTVIPLRTVPLESLTIAERGAENAVLIVADCGVP